MRGKVKVLTLTVLITLLSGCSDEEKIQKVHVAYCKMYDCKDLTYSEWQALYEKRLLPGQQQQAAQEARARSNINAAVMGAAIATGAASGGRK